MVPRTWIRGHVRCGRVLAFVASLLITGCGPIDIDHQCRTTRGATFMGVYPEGERPVWDAWRVCQSFQLIEDLTVAKVEHLPEMDPDRLNGVKIYVRRTAWWVDLWGRKIAGMTTCPVNLVEVGYAYEVYDSALSHEIIHIMQGCYPPQPPTMGTDADHSNWVRDGIYNAIGEIREEAKP